MSKASELAPETRQPIRSRRVECTGSVRMLTAAMSILRLAQGLPLPPGEFRLEICVAAAAFQALYLGVGHHHASAFAGESLHFVAAKWPAGLFLGGGEKDDQRGNEYRSTFAPRVCLSPCGAQTPD